MTNAQLADEIRYLRQQLDRGVSVRVFWKTVLAIIVAQMLMMVLGLVVFLFLAMLGVAGLAAGAGQASQPAQHAQPAQHGSAQAAQHGAHHLATGPGASQPAAAPQPGAQGAPQRRAGERLDEQRAAWEAHHRAFEDELHRLSDPG